MSDVQISNFEPDKIRDTSAFDEKKKKKTSAFDE